MYHSVMEHNSPLSYANESTRVDSPVGNKKIAAVNTSVGGNTEHRQHVTSLTHA